MTKWQAFAMALCVVARSPLQRQKWKLVMMSWWCSAVHSRSAACLLSIISGPVEDRRLCWPQHIAQCSGLPAVSSVANAFLVYSESRERVWWLQVSFFLAGELTALPQIPWLDLRGPLWGGEEERKREAREGKWRKDETGEYTYRNKFLFTFLSSVVCFRANQVCVSSCGNGICQVTRECVTSVIRCAWSGMLKILQTLRWIASSCWSMERQSASHSRNQHDK